nr:MAG: RNA-dependent RNA polymerase [Plasmopara viticola lesion associated ourmia-like virus 32]
MAGIDKSLNAFGSASCPHLLRFRKFCGILSSLYGVGLDCPEFTGSSLDKLSSFKKFCSGLIERRMHPWRVPLKQLGVRSRMSIAHSLFLFRKTLPAPPPDLNQFLDVISSPSPEPDTNFLDFCSREISKIFPTGWDRSLYPSKCLSATVSTSSCRENGKGSGGCRSWVLDNKMPDIRSREDFTLACLVADKYKRPDPSRLVAVDTGGKWRKITVPSGNQSLLRPLHQSIYDQLSKQKWLLRGKESVKAFSQFSSKAGECFYSGDYESATDFLNNSVSKHCLAQILMKARSVPHGISMMAMDSLSLPVELSDGDQHRVVDQTSGQMMGYLLSFPLLCLINYLTFRYAIPRDIPVKINGDDIVFRSTPEEYREWVKLVGKSGLVLSVGKTMVNRRFFTLNSCLFEGRNDGPRVIPFIRSTALFPKSKDPEMVMGLRGRYTTFCPGFSGIKRSFLRTEWLKLNRGLIDVTRRSVSRGLGLCVTFPELVNSGLWVREAWHLSLSVEKPIPAPFSEWSCRPKGYRYVRVERITKELKSYSEGISAAWLDSAWENKTECEVNDWFAEMKAETYDWGYWDKSRSSNALKRAKLLGISVRNAQRFLRPSRSLFKPESFKSIKRSIWIRDDINLGLTFESSSGTFDVPSSVDRERDPPRSIVESDDVRDYIVPTLSVNSVLVSSKQVFRKNFRCFDNDVSITCDGVPELELDPTSYISARVYRNGGIGIGPPSCLV